MTPFQYIALLSIAAALTAELVRALRGGRLYGMGMIRSSIWLAAAVAILVPELVQTVALWMGIRRGSDLVLYVFIMASLFITFFLYASQQAIERRVTELIRSHAIEHARRGTQAIPDVANEQGNPRET